MARELSWAVVSPLSRFRGYKHLHTPQSLRLLWNSDQPVAYSSILKHIAITRNRHLCFRRDSTSQSQQPTGRRPTPQTEWPLESAVIKLHLKYWANYFPLDLLPHIRISPCSIKKSTCITCKPSYYFPSGILSCNSDEQITKREMLQVIIMCRASCNVSHNFPRLHICSKQTYLYILLFKW